MRSKHITIYKIGEDKIIYERYTRPSGGINRFCGIILEELLGKRLHMYTAARIGSAIYLSKNGVVEASCIIYMKKFMTGFCIGNIKYINKIRETLGLKTILSIYYIPGCRETKVLRGERRTLYLCFY